MAASDPALAESAAIVMPASSQQDGLRQLEHFAELGRLSASLLHEISNPLAAALLYLEQHDSRHSKNVQQAKRTILLLKSYVEAARQQVRHESQVTRFCVRAQVNQVRQVLAPLARRKAVQLQIEASADYKIFGDPVKFQQILANLIINATDAYDTASRDCTSRLVTVRIDSRQQWLLIRVIDHGSGIPAERMSQVFEPFYSTKGEDGQGIGIGLAVVRQYVENDFGGSITVISSAEHGTAFTARLRLTPR